MTVNALIVRWTDGFIEVEDAASIAVSGRREGFLSLGNAPSAEEATRAAEATLARLAALGEQITATMDPAGGDQPYSDFFVGDTITVPDSAGAPVTRRVVALSVAEDENGDLTYMPDLRTS